MPTSTLARLFRPGQRVPDLDDDDLNELAEIVIEALSDRRGQNLEIVQESDPDPFPNDAGARLAYRTLVGRDHDAADVRARLETYGSDHDLWLDFFAPLMDRITEALGLPLEPEPRDA